MIKLHQFPRPASIPNDSPFCMKLESYFRATELDYDTVFTMDPRQSPTGKFPFIEHNKHYMSDSSLVIDHYEQLADYPLQHTLTPQQRAQSLAFQRLIEEHLYWVIVYSRWMDPMVLPKWKQKLQVGLTMPTIAFKLMFPSVKKRVEKQLSGHGIGRHDSKQIYQFAQDDLEALSVWLDNKPYCFNDQPTLLDHCLYSHTASLITMPKTSQLYAIIRAYPNLLAHCQRMMNQFFPEYPQLIEDQHDD